MNIYVYKTRIEYKFQTLNNELRMRFSFVCNHKALSLLHGLAIACLGQRKLLTFIVALPYLLRNKINLIDKYLSISISVYLFIYSFEQIEHSSLHIVIITHIYYNFLHNHAVLNWPNHVEIRFYCIFFVLNLISITAFF